MTQTAQLDILMHLTDSMSFNSREVLVTMVTITLNPKVYKYKSFLQYEMTINEMRRLCDNQTYRYVMVPELTKQGNIHYHCLCRFQTRLQEITFINKTKTKSPLFGFSKVSKPCESLKSVNQCIHYMFKDLVLTRKVLTYANYKPKIINSSYLRDDDIYSKYEEVCQTPEQKALIQKTLQEIDQSSTQESQSQDA